MQTQLIAPDEQRLLDAGWRIEDCNNDRHSLRKGGPATYRIYIPPDYRRNWRRPEMPQGRPVAWTLDDALRAQAQEG
jgi:hypothetical protein